MPTEEKLAVLPADMDESTSGPLPVYEIDGAMEVKLHGIWRDLHSLKPIEVEAALAEATYQLKALEAAAEQLQQAVVGRLSGFRDAATW